MMKKEKAHMRPPPHLSMDEYADLVEKGWHSGDVRRRMLQKEKEERIRARFRLDSRDGVRS